MQTVSWRWTLLLAGAGGAVRPPPPPHIANKVAQLVAFVASREYPARWPSLFADLLAVARERGETGAGTFCRVLRALDEDVISLDIPRSEADARRAAAFKDAMREACVTDVAAAWAELVAAYTIARPSLAAQAGWSGGSWRREGGARGAASLLPPSSPDRPYFPTHTHRHTPRQVLVTVKAFVHWVDVDLVAGQAGLAPHVLRLVGAPDTPDELRAAACGVLTEVLLKRMAPEAKLTLVEGLGIVDLCARWGDDVGGLPLPAVAGGDGDADDEAGAALGCLLATLAGELLDVWKKVDNAVQGLAAVGLAPDAEACAEAAGETARAAEALHRLMPGLLAALGRARGDDVAGPVVSFLQSYAGWLRRLQGRAERTAPGGQQSGAGLPPRLLGHVQAILGCVADRARAPEAAIAAARTDVPGAGAVNQTWSLDDDDVESADAEDPEETAERRRELLTLFRSGARASWAAAVDLTGRTVRAVLAPPPAPPPSEAEVEIALVLLHALGEGAPESDVQADGSLGQLAGLVAAGPVPHAASNGVVALAALETVVRYHRVLLQRHELLPPVLTLFLDAGLGSPRRATAARAIYLFQRLCRTLRGPLVPHLPALLARLDVLMARALSEPPTPEGWEAAWAMSSGPSPAASPSVSPFSGARFWSPFSSGAPGPDAGHLLPPHADVLRRTPRGGAGGGTSADPRIHVFEAVGYLLGQEEMDAGAQLTITRTVVARVAAQVAEHATWAGTGAGVGGGTGAGGGGGGAGGGELVASPTPTQAAAVAQALMAGGAFLRGFAPPLVNMARPALGEVLLGLADAALAVPAAWPGERNLTRRTTAFFHRLVEALGARIANHAAALLRTLLRPGASVADVGESVGLTTQLAQRFRGGVVPLLRDALPALAERVDALLPATFDWSGAATTPPPSSVAGAQLSLAALSEEARECGEVQKAFFSALHCISTSPDLVEALLTADEATRRLSVKKLEDAAGGHVDPLVRRVCLQSLTGLAGALLGKRAAAGGGARGEAGMGAGADDGADGGSGGGGGGTGEPRDWVVRTVAGRCCLTGLLDRSLDVRDAGVWALTSEAAVTLKAIHVLAGDDLAVHLASLLPTLDLPPGSAEQIASAVSSAECRALRTLLRSIMSAQFKRGRG